MSNYDLANVERPPDWHFSAHDTELICAAVRRVRYPQSAWPKSDLPEDELDELLDRLYAYLTARFRWERLYLPSLEDTPF